MPEPSQWQIQPVLDVPVEFVAALQPYVGSFAGQYAAQLLWQRGICDRSQLMGFLNASEYQPTSTLAFGTEMQQAIERLIQAQQQGEKVAIWGDFDADGITATAVLWDGLGQFFSPHQQLTYYIPNRLTESHGLSKAGLDTLAAWGCQLIVTCDTGSTSLDEIYDAQRLGIDVIITDHHTLPAERPPVWAIINPRYLPSDHALAHLSGVAVAYKLVEALYEALPDIAQQPLERLLDLVAIGLIADLVQLTGDCRYLAQRGIEQLQKNRGQAAPRPGIAKLLELCRKSGDRPTDISFGLGPRINAISRIQGDARFCVELLTSQDPGRCHALAMETELANSRRRTLQRDVVRQVKAKLAQFDLSTTSAIVLSDPQWSVGVLGLVAGQIAQEYGRPTILLSLEENSGMAKGSARSAHQIDLYQLVQAQAHLLHRFGGHPLAAGLSLPAENIPLFAEAINRQLRQKEAISTVGTQVQADLTVTVAVLNREAGKALFQELKLLEPCGMGNPVPRLLIQNCWFSRPWHRKIKALGDQDGYIKTEFELWDDSSDRGFPGIWWGHYKDELPLSQRCDVVVELDFNSFEDEKRRMRFELRLVALRLNQTEELLEWDMSAGWLLDWRNGAHPVNGLEAPDSPSSGHFPIVEMRECPSSWADWQPWIDQAIERQSQLAIAFSPPVIEPPAEIWQRLIGIAKYLSRTGETISYSQLCEKLGIGKATLQIGFQSLRSLGFVLVLENRDGQGDQNIGIHPSAINPAYDLHDLSGTLGTTAPERQEWVQEQFQLAVAEEQFYRRYFYEASLETLQAAIGQMRRMSKHS